MYSRVFVIELLTGVMKANVKRVEVIQEPVLAFFASIVERCEYLNLELQSLLECGFDLVYFFLSSGVTDAVHKLLSIITSVTRLAPEVFQAVASIIASGLTVLIAEYGRNLGVVGCWNAVIDLMNECMTVPHAVRWVCWSVFIVVAATRVST